MKIIKNHEEMEIISKEDFEEVQQVLKGKNMNQDKKRPIPPGYKIVEGKLVINEAEADVIREKFNNYVNGKCGEIGES